MSETKDYLEQNPELESLTPVELEKHLGEAGEKAEAAYDAMRHDEPEMTPAELWGKVSEHMDNVNAALRDLRDTLREFNKSVL